MISSFPTSQVASAQEKQSDHHIDQEQQCEYLRTAVKPPSSEDRQKTSASTATMNDPLEWYYEIPIISRLYLTGSFLTTTACALDLVSPFSLYFNFNLIFFKGQVRMAAEWILRAYGVCFCSIGVQYSLSAFVCIVRTHGYHLSCGFLMGNADMLGMIGVATADEFPVFRAVQHRFPVPHVFRVSFSTQFCVIRIGLLPASAP